MENNDKKVAVHGLKQETCEFCNKTDYSNRNTRTTDHKIVCLYCIEEPRLHYTKGLLSSEEVIKFKELKKKHSKELGSLGTLVRKIAMNRGEKATAILQEIYNMSNEAAVGKYTQDYSVLDLAEQLHIIVHTKILLSEELSQKDQDSLELGGSDGNFLVKFNNKYTISY